MQEVLIALGSAAIAGPISIAVKDRFADRKLRRRIDEEQPYKNAEQKRLDFEAVTSAYRRLLLGVESDLEREKKECNDRIKAHRRESARAIHDLRLELLEEVSRLEAALQKATGKV